MKFQNSADILIEVLKQSGLKFRLKKPDEEGGFFISTKKAKERNSPKIYS